jgi:hypothetical protein
VTFVISSSLLNFGFLSEGSQANGGLRKLTPEVVWWATFPTFSPSGFFTFCEVFEIQLLFFIVLWSNESSGLSLDGLTFTKRSLRNADIGFARVASFSLVKTF